MGRREKLDGGGNAPLIVLNPMITIEANFAPHEYPFCACCETLAVTVKLHALNGQLVGWNS
jgi:hypothetical protein